MDKIRLEQQTLETLQGNLNQMGSGLDEAAANIKKVDICKAAGGDIVAGMSGIRFQGLGQGLADEAVAQLISSLGVVTGKAADRSRDISQRVKEVVALMESTQNEVLGLINGEAVLTGQQVLLGNADAERQRTIMQVITQFDLVKPPEQHYSVQAADKLGGNWFYQFVEGTYAFLTGDWSHVKQTNSGCMSYWLESSLLACIDEDFELFSVDTPVDVISNYLDMLPPELQEALLKDWGLSDSTTKNFGVLFSTGKLLVGNVVGMVNNIRIFGSLNEEAAMSMAKAYQNSDDIRMQAVGNTLEGLASGSLVDRANYIMNDFSGDTAVGVGEIACYELAKGALEGAATKIGGGVTAGLAIGGAIADSTMNSGKTAELTNNMAYSTAAARTMYNAFQADYDAYKANPTPENLNKAMTSYQNYNRALSTTYDAYGEFAANNTDSMVGQLTASEMSKGADERAAQSADLYRGRASSVSQFQAQLNNPT